MGHPPEMLTCPVGELTEDLRRYLRDERWLDAALAAAAIWQAADDALARTSSPVTAVAGRVRRRTDPLGRPAGLALDATLHLQAARTVGAGRRPPRPAP
jgi:hypothetical protein